MSQDIRDFTPASCELLALGEPTHQEPAFGWLRNDLFAQLVDHGFGSIALETDRVAALAVNDYVQHGVGTLDTALRDGFSHGFGELAPNRALLEWLHDHNAHRPEEDRVAFHGFDLPTETMSAPSPRRYLERARDYLGLDHDITALTGADDRWDRTEAVLDPAVSPGATEEATRLRAVADDMLTTLYARTPELVAATSRADWFRAVAHLTAGIGLLRYHRQLTRPHDLNTRVSRLMGVRDALMARNLLDLRVVEARPTMVFAANAHLQRNQSRWRTADRDFRWFSAGAVVSALLGDRYTVIAGSMGRSAALDLPDPDPDTYEGGLQREVETWALRRPASVPPATTRDDTTPAQGYFPLDEDTLDAVDGVLHITGR